MSNSGKWKLPALGLVAAALAGGLGAQDPDPEAVPKPVPLRVRVVGHADGLPRPGVVLHVARPGAVEPEIDADGWLIAEDQLVRKLRSATTVRTDPEGCATIDNAVGRDTWRLCLGEPHYLMAPVERSGDELLVRVGENEPVGVRAVDATGRPLAQLAVALHAGGKDIAVAITDGDGKAVLGVPKDFTARIAVVPAGWVGPMDPFPSIAESLSGRRAVVLTVPAHGSLGLRAVRGGVPVKERVHGVSFYDPSTFAPLSAQPGVTGEATGIRFDHVALGVALASYSPFPSGGMIETGGPQKAGEQRVHDVDFGPRLTFRLRGGPFPLGPSVQVRAVTDAGSLVTHASLHGDDQGADYRRALPGKRLLRVEFDVVVQAAGERRAVVWSLAMPCDHALAAAAIDVGEVALVAHAPQLCGKVVDQAGAPVSGATVVVGGKDQEPRYQLTTDAAGRFEYVGPLLRDAKGALAEVVATARSGELRSELTATAGAGGEVVLTLRAVAAADAESARRRPEAKGRVVARVVGIRADASASDNLRLITGNGREYSPAETRAAADGLTELVFERLPAGRYALRARLPDGGPFIALDGIDVPAEGTCADERLLGLRLRDRLRTVTVRVVDEQIVPVAGARLVGPNVWGQTDGNGTLRITLNRDSRPSATIEVPGKRPQRIDEWPDERLVQLEPAGTIAVAVVGLPDDVPRDSLEVWIRDEVRERLAGPRATVGADGVARAELPARGRYVLWLLVKKPDGRGGMTATGVGGDRVPIVVGDAREQQFELKLDAEAVARVRAEIAKLRESSPK